MTAPDSVLTAPSRGLVKGLLGACHPAPTVAVTLVAVLLAAGVGLTGWRVVLFGAAVLTGQLSIGWSNDWLDAGRDAASGRRDKPAAAGQLPLRMLAGCAVSALLASFVLALGLGLRAGLLASVLPVAGWAYNLGLKSTVASALAYVVGFGALPAAPYLALSGHPSPPWWAPTTGALLGLGAHFANVLPDLRDDAATGVRGLPQRLGRRRGVLVMAAALAAATVVLGLGGASSARVGVAVACLSVLTAAMAAVLALRRPDSDAAFRVTLGIAVLDVVLFVVLSA